MATKKRKAITFIFKHKSPNTVRTVMDGQKVVFTKPGPYSVSVEDFEKLTNLGPYFIEIPTAEIDIIETEKILKIEEKKLTDVKYLAELEAIAKDAGYEKEDVKKKVKKKAKIENDPDVHIDRKDEDEDENNDDEYDDLENVYKSKTEIKKFKPKE